MLTPEEIEAIQKGTRWNEYDGLTPQNSKVWFVNINSEPNFIGALAEFRRPGIIKQYGPMAPNERDYSGLRANFSNARDAIEAHLREFGEVGPDESLEAAFKRIKEEGLSITDLL